MKRITAGILLLSMLFSLYACTDSPTQDTTPAETMHKIRDYPDPTHYKVPNPIEYPDYTFSEQPDVQQMRETVVRAFHDLLTVEWSTAYGIAYHKTGPISEKLFQHQPDVTYGGTIYSNASAGLFQFLEFYNFETGRLFFPGTSDEMKMQIGASCADAMIWGWTTVCNSITGPYYPSTMVYKNGYIPVGFYSYNKNIDSFYKLPTNKILAENGDEIMLESYDVMQPGDALVSTPDDHGMMVISEPVVVRNELGQIDPEQSYVYIQDQRGGRGAGFYEVEKDGYTLQLSGREKAKFTFQELLKKAYIPVAPAELLGEKEYEFATVEVAGGPFNTVADLLNAEISSNYPLAVVNVIAADKYGKQTVIEREVFGGSEVGGVPRTFALNQFDCINNFKDSKYNVETYLIQVEVVVSTGERFIPIEIEI